MADSIRLCGWDAVCLVLILAMTVAFILLRRRNRRKQHTLKEQLVHSYMKDTL